MKRMIIGSALALACLSPVAAQASTITCPDTGSPDRTITIYNVTSCAFGNSQNPNASTVAGILGGTWTNEGVLSLANGTNDLLTVTADAWGPDANGTWSINPTFWTLWGRGAISVHVGEGNGDPDYWVFEVTKGFTGTGTFDLNRLSGGGGGLSNFNLWGSGTPDRTSTDVAAVPEPASLLLLGTGLVFGATRLRKARAK